MIPIQLPPLRSRKEDILLLVDHFIRTLGREMKSLVRGVGEDAMEKLMAHRWPGNVRELKNVLERAMTFAEAEKLRTEDIMIAETDRLRIDTRSDEREKLVQALRESGGNQSDDFTSPARGHQVSSAEHHVDSAQNEREPPGGKLPAALTEKLPIDGDDLGRIRDRVLGKAQDPRG